MSGAVISPRNGCERLIGFVIQVNICRLFRISTGGSISLRVINITNEVFRGGNQIRVVLGAGPRKGVRHGRAVPCRDFVREPYSGHVRVLPNGGQAAAPTNETVAIACRRRKAGRAVAGHDLLSVQERRAVRIVIVDRKDIRIGQNRRHI